MVKCLHWAGETVLSRPLCGARSGARRIAILAISLAACFISNNANAQNWTGTTVESAKGKTVYLWNVGAKQFLGKGGKWGTEAIVSNVGTPFKVVSVSSGTYRLESIVKGQGSSSSNGALSFMNGKNSTHDSGNWFVDRSSDDDTYGTRTFTFDGSATGYQMKVTSKDGASSTYNGTFYLVANMEMKKMLGLKTVNADSTDYSKWIIVTEDVRKSYFEKAEASESSAVPATFLMFDNGFDRNDNNVTKWQTKTDATATGFDGKLSWTDNKEVVPSDACPWEKEVTYYTYTYTGSHTYTYSKRSCIHKVTYTVTTTTPPDEQEKTMEISCDKSTTSASYQHTTATVTVTLDTSKTTSETKTESNKGYQYYVGNGYIESTKTTVDEDGKTYSSPIHWQELYGGDWTANIHGKYGVVNQTIPNENMIREGWYKVSCVGFTTSENGTAQLYASAGTANEVGKYYAVQPLKQIADAPATYVKASRLVNGGGYEASVMVYVGKNDAGTLKTLSFGVLVDGADDCAWTCFDDFQISYLGMPNSPLVLDEDQTSVDYINAQTTPKGETNQKKTLYLHRTLNNNKWNSIVLPVTLTVGQVKSAFGDQVHISAFKGAYDENYPTRMFFEAINADRNNDNEVAIEAGKLYIIKPSKVVKADEKMEEIALPSSATVGTGKLTNYYTIPSVTFNEARAEFTAKVEGDKGNETFGGQTVQFVGTYVADNGAKQIPANSYVLNGNNVGGVQGLWYYRTVETKTKGFRGWLQVLNAEDANKISFSINGVVDDTTGISGLTIGGSNAANGNIYNLNGQLVRTGSTSTEGLAKGIYVVGGKKVVVK